MPRITTCKTVQEKIELIAFLRTGAYPAESNESQRRSMRRKAKHFRMIADDICYVDQRGDLLKAVFEFEGALIDHIIQKEHETAHMGIKKTTDLINRKYHGIPKSAISDYIGNCEACAHFNSLRTIQPLYINDIVAKYDRYMMDCVDLRRYEPQNDGYCWILNVIDTYTKYLWSFKLLSKSAIGVKESLRFIFNNFGVPRSIQSDNGKEFRNRLLQEFLEEHHVLIIHGRPRNPKAQGQVERVNQTVKRWLAKKLHGRETYRWIDHLDDVVNMYNRTVHNATSKSPFLLFHGHNGFNAPIAVGSAIDTETGLQAVDLDTQIVPDEHESINSWNLEISEEVPSLENESVEVLIDDPVSDALIKAEVATHFEKYKAKTIANKDSNLEQLRVELGDTVLIKADFDKNQNNKRHPFDSFYQKNKYIVSELKTNNMVTLENSETGEKKTVG